MLTPYFVEIVLNNLTFIKGPDEPAETLCEIISEVLREIGNTSIKLMKIKMSNMNLKNDILI